MCNNTDDRGRHMELGEPLARFALITEEETGKIHLVLTIHHALYDGWSMPLVVDRINRAYRGLKSECPPPFKSFIHHLHSVDSTASENYWRAQLQGATGLQFPVLPRPGYQTQAESLLEYYVPLAKKGNSWSGASGTAMATTVATAIRAAWALVAARYMASEDVVFGETLTGRNAPVVGVERIEGPMITTVPVRVRVDRSVSTAEVMQEIHDRTVDRTSTSTWVCSTSDGSVPMRLRRAS